MTKLLFVTLLTFSFGFTVVGQCVDDSTPTPDDVKNGYRTAYMREETEDEKKKQNGLREVPTHVLAKIGGPTTFKVSLESDITSGFYRPNDYVVFSVLENVYGFGSVPGKKLNNKGEWQDVMVRKRCIVIPKDTKFYGLVDHSRAQLPFYVKGKAKIFVTVRDFKLPDGTMIKISFSEPPPQQIGKGPSKPSIVPCRNYTARMCIAGRREKIKIPASAVGAGAGTAVLLAQNNVADEPNKAIEYIATFGLVESLSKITGVDNLVNPANASLKSKMIFDVTTEGEAIAVWVSIAPTEKPKEAEKPKE